MSAIQQNAQTELQLPRDVAQYRHTTHSRRRFHETKRMVHGGIIRETIENGELTEGDTPDSMKFVLEWSVFTYEIVVAIQPESDGIHPIITIYHNF